MVYAVMRKLSDILGQDGAVGWLRAADQADRLPHGLIFAGPAGVGKGTTAEALAGLFLCEKPKASDACGQCPSCVVFAAGNHPDYHLVYRQLIRLEHKDRTAKDLPVEVVRQCLVGPANLKSAMGRGKVFVVEEADMMNAYAQNALLKTLEEPYGRTLTVLLTDQPGALLPTIQSRCQVVRFAAMESGLVARELSKRGLDSADAADAAVLAEGSLGLAIKWIEDGVVARGRELRDRVEAMLGGQEGADLPDWFKAASENYAEKQLERDELASKEQATREGLGVYLRLMSQMFCRRLRQSSTHGQAEVLCGVIEALGRAERYLDSNVNVSLIFQQLAVTLEQLLAMGGGQRR